MTYRELKEALAELTEEQLGMAVTILQILGEGEFSLQNVSDCVLASEVPRNLVDIEFEDCTEENLPCLLISGEQSRDDD